jgi:inner membrane protein
VENLTHSLVGAALAHVALRDTAGTAERRIFLAAGIVAANLPDADLLYTSIAPAPLGYILHHRGHTHTLWALAAQSIVMGAIVMAPVVRRLVDASRARLWGVIVAALVSHLLLDSWNSYGVHPFHPINSRWFYGDAVFIFEPWLWVLLGGAAAANARRRWIGIAIAAPLVALISLLAWTGVVPPAAIASLVTAGGVLGWLSRTRSRAVRSAGALIGCALFVACLFGFKQLARASALDTVRPMMRGALVDLVLTPHPGAPLCWDALAIEKDEPGGDYVLRRGTLSIAPRILPPVRCSAGELAGGSPPAPAIGPVIWRAEVRQSLGELRELAQRDCWVRAWMQFGRAPFIRMGEIADFRFENNARSNFTAMRLAAPGEVRSCPRNLTSWEMPRADLLR